jgi:hypothetical protein
MLGVISRAADTISAAAATVLAQPPVGADPEGLVAFATRGRGLLAHGTGRLTIHRLGRLLGVSDDATAPDTLRQFMEVDEP